MLDTLTTLIVTSSDITRCQFGSVETFVEYKEHNMIYI